MKNYILLVALLTFIFSMNSCKKNKTTDPTPTTTPTGTLIMHLHTNIDTNEVDSYDTLYTTAEGRSMSLHLAQMYISGIQLVKLDGTTYDVPGTGGKFLKVMETEGYPLQNIPVGNYKSIRFKVGLDAATNALNPTDASESSLLNIPAMWFSTPVQPDGYVFANVQGTIDTSAAMNKTPVTFSYKIGTNANLVSVSMPDQNYSVSSGGTTYSHMIIDYSQLFSGIQLNQVANLSVGTAAENASSIATLIKNNIPLMFHYE